MLLGVAMQCAYSHDCCAVSLEMLPPRTLTSNTCIPFTVCINAAHTQQVWDMLTLAGDMIKVS
jgi:hypothetical protein